MQHSKIVIISERQLTALEWAYTWRCPIITILCTLKLAFIYLRVNMQLVYETKKYSYLTTVEMWQCTSADMRLLLLLESLIENNCKTRRRS